MATFVCCLGVAVVCWLVLLLVFGCLCVYVVTYLIVLFDSSFYFCFWLVCGVCVGIYVGTDVLF